MRSIISFAIMIMLGAGCVRSEPSAPIDDTPASNPENCVSSGGSIVDGVCACPDGYSADPADFCLDSAGVPGKNPADGPSPIENQKPRP